MLELLNQGKNLLEQEPQTELNELCNCPCDGCYVAPCGCMKEFKPD